MKICRFTSNDGHRFLMATTSENTRVSCLKPYRVWHSDTELSQLKTTLETMTLDQCFQILGKYMVQEI